MHRNKVVLFDQLVGAGKQRRRHFDAERFGGLQVDHQIVFRGYLNRKVGGLFALEDSIDVLCSMPKLVDDTGPIGDQASCDGEVAVVVDCW